MSFYISYAQSIRKRKVPHIFYLKDDALCMFSGKEEVEIGKSENSIISVLEYIKSNNISDSEILMPLLSEKQLDEGCEAISSYLLENDDSIGILTSNPNFRIDYAWLIDKYGITYSIPFEKPSLGIPERKRKPKSRKILKQTKDIPFVLEEHYQPLMKSCAPKAPLPDDDLESGLSLDEPFNAKFFKLLNESGKSNAEVYTKGGITRQVFSNILIKKDSIPRKDTVICLIIGMELNYVDALNLLGSAGYTLSKSIVSDVVVMRYLKRGIYDIDLINAELDERGCSLLGWKPRND